MIFRPVDHQIADGNLKLTRNTVPYMIKSRPNLFQRYLEHPSVLKLEVMDAEKPQSSGFISRCDVDVWRELEKQQKNEFSKSCPLFDLEGTKTGELVVQVQVHFFDAKLKSSFELNEDLAETDPALPLWPTSANFAPQSKIDMATADFDMQKIFASENFESIGGKGACTPHAAEWAPSNEIAATVLRTIAGQPARVAGDMGETSFGRSMTDLGSGKCDTTEEEAWDAVLDSLVERMHKLRDEISKTVEEERSHHSFKKPFDGLTPERSPVAVMGKGRF